MAYATVDELAAALRVTVTAANTDGLQACLDAAAAEIDHALYLTVQPISSDDDDYALVNRVNVLRGVEWFKANDAAFGVLGFNEAGPVRAPRDSFARHAVTLLPVRHYFGVA